MKITKQFLQIIIIFFSISLLSQSLPSSLGTTLCYSCTPNSNWENVKGTPDVSNRNNVAAAGTLGGGESWTGAPLPLPPNNHSYWITIRDTGNPDIEEIIGTTLTGMTIGQEYEIFVYSLTAKTATYSPAFIDVFDFQIEGESRMPVTNVTNNIWGIKKLRFTAKNSSRWLRFYPGFNATDPNFESVNISISVNAINAVPKANNDFARTIQGNTITFNITANDSDPNGLIVASSVDIDPSSPGIQKSLITTQGSWTVTNTGNITFIPAEGFYGIATIPYTIQDNYTLDGLSAPSTSSPATISVFVAKDTDNDGVPDYLDLDSDNDGILDTVECPPTNTVVNGMPFLNGLTGWTISPGAHWANVDGFATNTLDLASNHILSQTVTNLNKVKGGVIALSLKVGAQDGTNAAGSTATLKILIDNVLYATLNNSTVRNMGTNNITITYANGASGNFLPFSTAVASGFTDTDFTLYIPYNGPSSASLAFIMDAGNDDWRIGNLNIPLLSCDRDGDGIPNYLDLDSDNDGCSDANEYYNNTTSATTGQQFGQTGGAVAPVNADGTVNLPAATYSGTYPNATTATNASISSQPTNRTIDAETSTTFTVSAVSRNTTIFDLVSPFLPNYTNGTDNAANIKYQWQVSADAGATWIPLSNGGVYSGVTTNTLTISAAPILLNNNQYRAIVTASNHVCTILESNSATLVVIPVVCYEDPSTSLPGADSKHGITLLQRAGTDNGNWPMIRKSAHTVLESNTKGFVITRMTTNQITAIISPQEGMMVFDTNLKCLKLYDGISWSCFNNPTCP